MYIGEDWAEQRAVPQEVSDAPTRPETFDFESIAKELFRVTKPGGVVVWVVGDATVDGSETGTSFRQALFFKDCGFNLHDTMIYRKQNPTPYHHNRYNQVLSCQFPWLQITLSILS